MGTRMALLLLATGLAVLAGCGGAGAAPTGAKADTKAATPSAGPGAPTGPAKAVAPVERVARLEVIEDGVSRPLGNGGRMAIQGGGTMEVFIAPYPPSPESELHLYFTRGPTDEPVTDATVALRAEMQFMDHGVITVSAEPREPGHYVGPLPLGMYGEWLVDVDARGPNWTGWGELLLRVFP